MSETDLYAEQIRVLLDELDTLKARLDKRINTPGIRTVDILNSHDMGLYHGIVKAINTFCDVDDKHVLLVAYNSAEKRHYMTVNAESEDVI